MWQFALLPGALIGLGVTLLIAQLLPSQPRLSAAIQRLNATTTTHQTSEYAAPSFKDRIGTWVQGMLPEALDTDQTDVTHRDPNSIAGRVAQALTIPTRDLALIGMPVNEYLYKKTWRAALLLVLPTLVGIELQLIGFMPFYIPALAGPILAAVGWISVDIQVRRDAAAARQEFSRAVAIYLELVAAQRKRGNAAGESLMESANVGRSWVFVRIREELTRAQYAGVQPWDALSRFSKEISVPELNDVANIMRQSGEQGSPVYETLRQRGRSLRVQLLNDEQTKANKTTQMLAVPMTGLAGVFVGIIMTALLLNLLAS